MGTKIYKADCKGCQLSRGDIKPDVGGEIINLEGDWTLNHYGGSEGFLGWMALQPRYHRIELSELSGDEVQALGGNIQKIDLALRQYWALKFEDDLIERVYVVYFAESTVNPGATWHQHIHLIPRPRSLGQLLRGYSKDKSVEAWRTPKLRPCEKNFPKRYLVGKGCPNERALMTYLKEQLNRL
jgi:diadenosine tetraphosphate (Ap4A) HIT family hydrolase